MAGGIFIHFFKKERTRNEEIIYQSANEWQSRRGDSCRAKGGNQSGRRVVERTCRGSLILSSQSAPVGAKPLWFIGKSLEFLSDADIAYFAKDWQKARGCKIEHERAVEYGIPRIDHV